MTKHELAFKFDIFLHISEAYSAKGKHRANIKKRFDIVTTYEYGCLLQDICHYSLTSEQYD